MKIKELKEILNGISPEMDDVEIFWTMTSGCCGDFEELENVEATVYPPDNRPDTHQNKYKGGLRIDFSSLPGYRTCGQVAHTKRQDKFYVNPEPDSLKKDQLEEE